MKSSSSARAHDFHEWQPEGLGRRLPRSLRQARDLTTARRIVATAENIFSERGLAGARMDEIAHAANVNKALLYYYFRSKEELYRFVLDTLLSQLRSRVGDERSTSLCAQKQITSVVDHFFDFVTQHPNYPRLIQREMMGHGPNVEWIVAEYYRPLHKSLLHLIERGISAGEFRHVDTRHTALTIVSIMVFYFSAAPVLGLILGQDPLSPREVVRRRKAVQDFLEHGLFQPKTERKARTLAGKR